MLYITTLIIFNIIDMLVYRFETYNEPLVLNYFIKYIFNKILIIRIINLYDLYEFLIFSSHMRKYVGCKKKTP